MKGNSLLCRCTTLVVGLVLAFIPACIIFQGLSDYEQPIDVIAPAVKSPCRALGFEALFTLAVYAFVWCGIARKRLRIIGIGFVVMMTLLAVTAITQHSINSVSFESEELSSKRLNLSESQMRYMLETSINGLDGIQRSLKCCGLDNYTDWHSNTNFTCVSPSVSKHSCSIPETCCEDYTLNSAQVSHSRVMFLQVTNVREREQHCGKDALKPFVGLPYEKPKKSNSDNNSKDMKKNLILEDGCVKKSKTFLDEFVTKNLMLGGFILLSQVFGVVASAGFFILIQRDRDGRGEAQDTVRDRNNNNCHRNPLQPRRNSNVDTFSNTFELKEIDSSSHMVTENGTDSESETAAVHLSDTESREDLASVKLSDIASKKPAATTNRQHSESRNDAAATNLFDTGSVHPTNTESKKCSVSVKLSDIESKIPLATANPKHSESRKKAAAAASSLTATESMKGATDDINPSVFESTNGSEALCSMIDMGSRPNSPESECKLCVKGSPTYKRISALFENTAGYKLEESQGLLATEDSDVEDPAKSYLYDSNEMFFVTTTV